MITEVAVTAGAITEAALSATPSGIGAFGDWLTSLGGLADVLVALGSSGLLVVLYKVAGLIRYLRSSDFDTHAMKLIEQLINKHSKNPELIKSLASSAAEIEQVKELIGKAGDAKNDLLLELEGRRIDVVAKIKSGLFEGDELTALHEYLSRLDVRLNETNSQVK